MGAFSGTISWWLSCSNTMATLLDHPIVYACVWVLTFPTATKLTYYYFVTIYVNQSKVPRQLTVQKPYRRYEQRHEVDVTDDFDQ